MLKEGTKIRMKRDSSSANTVVESFLSAIPEGKRVGFITSTDVQGFFWAKFPGLDNYECAIFKDEFYLC